MFFSKWMKFESLPAQRWGGRVAAVFLGQMKWQMILWWSTSKLHLQLLPRLCKCDYRRDIFWQINMQSYRDAPGTVTDPTLGSFFKEVSAAPQLNSLTGAAPLLDQADLWSSQLVSYQVQLSKQRMIDNPLLRRVSRATMTYWTRWGAGARQSKTSKRGWIVQGQNDICELFYWLGFLLN